MKIPNTKIFLIKHFDFLFNEMYHNTVSLHRTYSPHMTHFPPLPPPRIVTTTEQRFEVAFRRAILDHLFTVTLEHCLLFVKKRFILLNREAVSLDGLRIIYIVFSCTLRTFCSRSGIQSIFGSSQRRARRAVYS